MMKDLKVLIEEATRNASEDRAATKVLLTNIMKYMQSVDERHREVGLIAAKYLETLQRSNEQLVKIAALVQKKEALTKSTSMSEEERDELVDLINQKEDS